MKKRGLNLPRERAFIAPASILKRLLAFLADSLIINLVLFFPFRRIIQKLVPHFSSYSEAYSFLSSNQSYTSILTTVSLVMSLFAILYFALIEYRIQQTPGKMIFNIFIVNESKKPGFWQFLARSLFIIPVFPFFLLWVIDPLFMFLTKTNQRLSEILSKTKTVQSYNLG